MMNRNVLAAMITLEQHDFSVTDLRLDREIVRPGATPSATINALGSLHMQTRELEHKLISESKGWAARIDTMTDDEIETVWTNVVKRYRYRVAFLKMTGKVNEVS